MTFNPTPLPQGERPKTLMMPDSALPKGARGLGGEGNGAVLELTLREALSGEGS